MERTISTKFYTFNQNNSGGYCIINDDVAEYLIIEAANEEEAISKMNKITENHSEFCSCCGERWSEYCDEYEYPMIRGEDVKTYENKGFNNSTIIYYYDGTKEKLRYEEEDEQ